MTIKSDNAVIVGGGIAGILAALLLGQRCQNVHLVERAPRLGGLLQSIRNSDGIEFDFGTHFLRQTGVSELDAELFDELDEDVWQRFTVLKAGNYFASCLNTRSPFIDISTLPTEIYRQGLVELLEITTVEPDAKNLQSQLERTFGPALVSNVFQPVLHGLLNVDLEELAVDAHLLFGMNRVTALNANAARELKKSEVYDERLAYYSFDEGVSGLVNFYPKSGGIGRWIDLMTEKLERCGVHIHTGAEIEHVRHNNGVIQSVNLSDGRAFDCDQLVWTVPLFLFYRAVGTALPPGATPPQWRTTVLLHYVFDRPFQCELFYFTCFDPDFQTFRVTLYPNIQGPAREGIYHLTVEMFADGDIDEVAIVESVRQELVDMGVVAADAGVVSAQTNVVRAGFPLPTLAFAANCAAQYEQAAEQFDNVLLLGKASGRAFFMQDVLIETYEAVTHVN